MGVPIIMKCMGLSAGGEQRQLVPACIPHILCRRGQRESQFLTTSSTVLCTHTEEEIGKQRERRSISVANKTVNLKTNPPPSGCRAICVAVLPAQHRQLSAIELVFYLVT